MDCFWCKETMDNEAVVCPTCKRERKDFHNLKIAMYSFMSIATITLGYAMGSGSWNSVFLEQFEFSLIFSTISGWVFITSFIISQIFYIKASRLIKTWWWI